jgi:endoglucanase
MNKFALLLIALTSEFYLVTGQTVIKVNQAGYRTGFSKFAWVNDLPPGRAEWSVRNSVNNYPEYEATVEASDKTDAATGEKVTLLDFSSFNNPGSFYIQIENTGISYEFNISDSVLVPVWSAGIKSYYFQRSGMDLTPEYAGIWARNASHCRDAKLYLGYKDGKITEGEYRKAFGGWYDAGDFGKKIVPACVAFYAWLKLAEWYPEKINQPVHIPNPYKNLPDMLAEAKWELDWFFKMQEPDGSVHHLIVSPDFFMGPPQKDTFPRYVMPVTGTATADFAAAMALASKVYRKYLPDFADSCLAASKRAWDYLSSHPSTFPTGGYKDPEGIHNTGAYEDPDDRDERLWAAAELFNVTGEKVYNDYFVQNQSKYRLHEYGWWMDVHNYAFYSWLLAPFKKDAKLEETLKTQLKEFADSLGRVSRVTGYGVVLSPAQYVWGSNSYIANYGMELLIINRILNTGEYTGIALHQLNYILGGNSLNLSFVSGYGRHAVSDPHQSINSYDQINQAPPGFIPGGPNQYPQDPSLAMLIKQKNPPPAKCYVDFHWSYACNEVCLPYNSGFIFLAGYFLK